MQEAPPGPNATRRLADRKEGVEYDAIDAVVGSLQQFGVVFGKRIGRALVRG